ncbi:MAG: DUF1573 domain-containing protein [Bacteroidales bacterium]
MSYKILYINLILLALVMSLGCGQEEKEANANQDKEEAGSPAMEFEKVYHDFGSLKAGEKVSYTFKFKNSGGSELIIKDAVAGCGCTVPKYDKHPIAPGEKGSVEVIFDTRGRRGTQIQTVLLKTNTPYGEKTLTIKANVVSN